MPLVTEDIDEARLAYINIESRAQSAELRANVLQDTVDKLRAQIPITAQLANVLTQQTTDQAAVNAQLVTQQVAAINSDIPLGQFIATVGMSVALGESTMPDRAIPSVTTSVTAYHTPDGGLRFYQPEFGDSSGPGTTSFSIVKIPGPAGTAAPRSLYLVLENMQFVFDNPFWTNFATAAAPPSVPAQQIVVEAAQVMANAGGWNFPFLVQEAAVIAAFQLTLANLLAQSSSVKPSAQPQVAAFQAAVQALTQLAKAFDPAVKPSPVAGDLLALTAAIDATVLIADSVRTA
jgi:hypothetical protein